MQSQSLYPCVTALVGMGVLDRCVVIRSSRCNSKISCVTLLSPYYGMGSCLGTSVRGCSLFWGRRVQPELRCPRTPAYLILKFSNIFDFSEKLTRFCVLSGGHFMACFDVKLEIVKLQANFLKVHFVKLLNFNLYTSAYLILKFSNIFDFLEKLR